MPSFALFTAHGRLADVAVKFVAASSRARYTRLRKSNPIADGSSSASTYLRGARATFVVARAQGGFHAYPVLLPRASPPHRHPQGNVDALRRRWRPGCSQSLGWGRLPFSPLSAGTPTTSRRKPRRLPLGVRRRERSRRGLPTVRTGMPCPLRLQRN